MITKEYGKHILACDTCGEMETLESVSSYQEAVEYAQKQGWKRTRKDGEWENHCPDCSGYLYA